MDEYHGQGGTYLVDTPKPASAGSFEGSRTEPSPATRTEVLTDATPDSQTPDRGED
jgi:hypothetical protein